MLAPSRNEESGKRASVCLLSGVVFLYKIWTIILEREFFFFGSFPLI